MKQIKIRESYDPVRKENIYSIESLDNDVMDNSTWRLHRQCSSRDDALSYLLAAFATQTSNSSRELRLDLTETIFKNIL